MNGLCTCGLYICHVSIRGEKYSTRHILSAYSTRACACPQLCLTLTLWTVTRQAPLSMGFSRQEYWSGLPFSSPGDPDPGIEPVSPALVGGLFTTEPPGKPHSTGALVPKPGSLLKPSVELYKVLLLRPHPRDSALTGIRYCVGQTAAP